MDTYNFYRFSIHSPLPALLIPRDCNVYFNLLIIETHTLACPIFKISQFIIDKLSNIIYNSFIFNILHIYNYQGERTRNPLRGLHLVHVTSCHLLQFITLPCRKNAFDDKKNLKIKSGNQNP